MIGWRVRRRERQGAAVAWPSGGAHAEGVDGVAFGGSTATGAALAVVGQGGAAGPPEAHAGASGVALAPYGGRAWAGMCGAAIVLAGGAATVGPGGYAVGVASSVLAGGEGAVLVWLVPGGAISVAVREALGVRAGVGYALRREGDTWEVEEA